MSKPNHTSVRDTFETRPLKEALFRGFKRKCPECGDGKLFGGYLTVKGACTACGLPFHHHRADDAPAWVTMVITAHLVAPAMLYVSTTYEIADKVAMIMWPAVTSIIVLSLLPIVKGGVIGFQWAKRMHGFGQIDRMEATIESLPT